MPRRQRGAAMHLTADAASDLYTTGRNEGIAGLYIRAPRLAGCKSNQVPDMIRHTLVHLSLPILFLKTARIFWACFLCSDRLVHHNLSCHNHRVRRPTDLGGSFDGILQPSLESYARAVRARGPLCRA